MPLTQQEIEQQIDNLSQSMPRLLQGSQSAEFWIEFMERADAIQDHAPLSLRDGITGKLHELLAHYGIAPPWQWIRRTARVYDFRSSLRLS